MGYVKHKTLRKEHEHLSVQDITILAKKVFLKGMPQDA
jgi:hypothetical protein